jgi:glucose-1-phosphate adenylyltransferase
MPASRERVRWPRWASTSSTRELLEQLLVEDAANDPESRARLRPQHHSRSHREAMQVFAYPFQDVKTRAQNYWRDVGTVDAYYEANLELVHVAPELNIYDEEWPIWTYQVQQPPAKFVLDEEGIAAAWRSTRVVSGGCIVSGAVVRNSLLFSERCASTSARRIERAVVHARRCTSAGAAP